MNVKCPSCAESVPEESVSCPSCGAFIDNSFAATRRLSDSQRTSGAKAQTPVSQHQSQTTSFDSIDNARFVPGAIVAERYRIVGLLGRGGMGEVYRADDLKLGQAVALKFLPENLSQDGAALARFHREVRIARQVSHRNVCRVYDIGEVAGQQFLSMEFIRGEELSSLLRRIGRLPSDKAVEISRQICAGLAAAHDNGVLHRDLKPANVMIDENGNARITDFGLAGLAEDFRGEGAIEGTPTYMSPEQIKGQELSVKSDIYSLGLVLYEIFTGKKAFEARTLPELIKLRKSDASPSDPSTIVKDLDPLVERTILRCLEIEPEKRPSSALQVAAALPGGDPLAAALAAGETPSPEMVAAAHKEGGLRPAIAISLLALTLAGLIPFLFLSGKVMIHGFVPLTKSPEILQERAREIIRRLGYTDAPLDSHYEFGYEENYLRYINENDRSRTRWQQLRTGQPGAILFRYRQSPRSLVPFNTTSVTPDDPPRIISGMAGLSLDTSGRMYYFYEVPQQIETEPAENVPATNWGALFTEAGLDINQFKPSVSRWVPAHYSDARAAWDGVFPERTDIPIHVEAASYRGKPVYFEIIVPWDRPSRQVEVPPTLQFRIIQAFVAVLLLLIALGAVLLAWRNLKLGRGDRRGAFRLAVFVFAMWMLNWAVNTHHVPLLGPEWEMLLLYMALGVFIGCIYWLVYMALEPFVRRRWPHRIVAWSKLLAGDVRDPLIGRDILTGAAFGIGAALLTYLWRVVPATLGLAQSQPIPFRLNVLLGARGLENVLTGQIATSLLDGLGLLFALLLLSMLLRRERVAIVVLWLFVAVMGALTSENLALDLLFSAILSAALLFVLLRYGLLSSIIMFFFLTLSLHYPFTTDFSAWYSTNALIALFISLALVAYGFYTSLAGEPIFKGALLRDD